MQSTRVSLLLIAGVLIFAGAAKAKEAGVDVNYEATSAEDWMPENVKRMFGESGNEKNPNRFGRILCQRVKNAQGDWVVHGALIAYTHAGEISGVMNYDMNVVHGVQVWYEPGVGIKSVRIYEQGEFKGYLSQPEPKNQVPKE